MEYAPKQRTVRVDVLTPSGWLHGDLHVPERAPLVDWLHRAPEWLNLTDVRLNAQVPHAPHFALRCEAAYVILPSAGEGELQSHLASEPVIRRRIHCLLPFAVAHGTIDVAHGVRTSDWLRAHRSRFVVLADSTWAMRVDGACPALEAIPRAIVATAHVLGVSDL
jgi:hypothetical protein